VEVFTGGLLAVAAALYAVVAGGDAAVVHLYVWRRMRELALVVAARALVALELPAHLELQPARVLHVEDVVHGHHAAPPSRGRGGAAPPAPPRGGGGLARRRHASRCRQLVLVVLVVVVLVCGGCRRLVRAEQGDVLLLLLLLVVVVMGEGCREVGVVRVGEGLWGRGWGATPVLGGRGGGGD